MIYFPYATVYGVPYNESFDPLMRSKHYGPLIHFLVSFSVNIVVRVVTRLPCVWFCFNHVDGLLYTILGYRLDKGKTFEPFLW